jgi:hypothetical protein
VEGNEPTAPPYYPNSGAGASCAADGKQPSWYPAEDMFDNPEVSAVEYECFRSYREHTHLNFFKLVEQDCCEKHYNWTYSDCIRNSIAADKPVGLLPVYYPEVNRCINTGTPPSYLTSSDVFDNQVVSITRSTF